MNNYKPFKPFIYSQARSQMYGNEYTVIETIGSLIKLVNELGIQVNEITEETLELLYNLNGKISEEVKELLKTWLDDGSLGNVINKALEFMYQKKEDKIAPKNGSGLNRLFRMFNSSSMFYEDKLYYSNGQGFTYKGSELCLIGLIPVGIYEHATNDARLVEVSLQTGAVVRDTIVTGGEHINSISYNEKDKEIYIAPAKNNITGLDTNWFIVLDDDTLKEKRKVVCDDTVTSVSYDNKSDKLYVRNGRTVKEVDKLTGTTLTTILLQFPPFIGQTGQSFCVDAPFIYQISFEPNTICVYNMDGTLNRYYNVPKYANQMYDVGECEDIAIYKDGRILINYVSFLNSQQQYCINSIAEMDFMKSVNDFPYDTLQPRQVTSLAHLYVDCNSTVSNPTGTQDKPFRTLQECTNVLYNGFYKKANIHLMSSGAYGYLYLIGLDIPIVIQSDLPNNTDAVIVGLYLERCYQIDIRNVYINKFQKQDSLCNINKSNVFFENTRFCGNCINKAMLITKSNVHYKDCSVANFANSKMTFMDISQGSNVQLVSLKTGATNTEKIADVRTGSRLMRSGNTMAKQIVNDNNAMVYPSLTQFYTGSGASGSYVVENLDYYNMIIIDYKLGSKNFTAVLRNKDGDSTSQAISGMVIENGNVYFGTFDVKVEDSIEKITVSNFVTKRITSSTNVENTKATITVTGIQVAKI